MRDATVRFILRNLLSAKVLAAVKLELKAYNIRKNAWDVRETVSEEVAGKVG